MTESCRRWKGSISDLGEWTYEGSPNLTVGADGNSNRYDESICRYVKFHTGGNQNFGFCSFGDGSFFYFIGNCFPRNKNAPRGSHCGGVEDVACATRRRRRILQSRILFHRRNCYLISIIIYYLVRRSNEKSGVCAGSFVKFRRTKCINCREKIATTAKSYKKHRKTA